METKSKRIITKSGVYGWQDRIQNVYKTFEELEKYDSMYGLAARLGCTPESKRTLQDIWKWNSHIEGSINPEDSCLSEIYALDNEGKRIDVINPGDYFGKAYIVGVEMGYHVEQFVVEANGEGDAIDEFVDSKFGHLAHIPDDALGDYDMGLDGEEAPEWATWRDLTGKYRTGTPPREVPHYGGNCGEPCDLDNIQLHDAPKALRYFGPFIPQWGLTPKDYSDWGNVDDSIREVIEQMSVEFLKDDCDVKELADYLEAYNESVEADARAKRYEQDLRMYGANPAELVQLLCRTHFPWSAESVLPGKSADNVEQRAKEVVINSWLFHEPGVNVECDNVTVNDKSAKAVTFCIWNREANRMDRFTSIDPNWSWATKITIENGINRMVKLSHWATPDGDNQLRMIIDEFTTATK